MKREENIMSLLPVNVYGDQILREKAKPVENFDMELIQNISDMFETMRNADGVGLAANQVGLNKSIFVIDISVVEEFKDFKPMVFINPEIVESSEETLIMEEGCLSLPGLHGEVERSEKVKIEFTDPDENRIVLEAEGYLARVIQHEYDHLMGVVFTDKLIPGQKKKVQKDLLRIVKRDFKSTYAIAEKK